MCELEWILAGAAAMAVATLSFICLVPTISSQLGSFSWMMKVISFTPLVVFVNLVLVGLFLPEEIKIRCRIWARCAWIATTIAWLVLLISGISTLTSEEKQWAASGLTIDRSTRKMNVSDDQNVVAAYKEVLDEWEKDQDHSKSTDAVQLTDVDAVDAIFQKHPRWRELAAAARDGQHRPEWKWPTATSDNLQDTSDAGLAMGVVHLYSADALSAYKQGDQERVHDDLIAITELSRHCATDLGDFGLLVSFQAINDTGRISRLTLEGDTEIPEQLTDAMRQLSYDRIVSKVLAEKLADWIRCARQAFTRGGATAFLDRVGMGQWDQATGLRAGREEYEKRMRLPIREWKALKIDAPFWLISTRFASITTDEVILPRLMKAESTRVKMILALDLKRWKHEHGEYPDDLSVLTTPLADPLTGLPMKYEKIGAGFRLTSEAVGPEKKSLDWEWKK